MNFLLSDWARIPGDRKWHSISTVEFNGSTITRCRGRWPSRENDSIVQFSNAPPDEDRCGECCRVLRKYAAFDMTEIDP